MDLPPNDEVGTYRPWPPLASINAVSVWPIVRADEWCSDMEGDPEARADRPLTPHNRLFPILRKRPYGD
jgi:hypothetical protein